MNQKLLNACMGKSESAGGMNLPEFKKVLKRKYPSYAKDIDSKTRKGLSRYCRLNKRIKQDMDIAKSKYFKEGVPLTKRQKNYCRCVAHVAVKNPKRCYKNDEWKKRPPVKGCYNPYAICTKNIGRKSRFHCIEYMDLKAMPRREVQALADLKGMSIDKLHKLGEKVRSKYS
jgi:hypothetical protein